MMSVVDLRRALRDMHPNGSKFFQFYTVFGKIWQNCMLALTLRFGAPALGKSLMSHWVWRMLQHLVKKVNDYLKFYQYWVESEEPKSHAAHAWFASTHSFWQWEQENSEQQVSTYYCSIRFVRYVNLLQIIRSYRAVLNCLNLTRNTHDPQVLTEYRGWGLFLNLKLDPSPVCLKELQRNKLTTHCTWIVQKDSLHFSFVSFTKKRK